MKAFEKIINASKIFFLIAFISLITGFILYNYIDDNPPIPKDSQITMDNWTVTEPDGSTLTAGSSYVTEGRNPGTFTMTATLPSDIKEGQYFCVVIGGDVKIYVNDELRKEFTASKDVLVPGGCAKRFYLLTPLHPEDSGARITFIRMGTTSRGFVYQNTFIASSIGILDFLMSHFGAAFIMSAVLLIFSAVLVIISIALRLVYKRPIAMLYGSASIFVISAWLITNSYLFPFISGHYHIDGIANYSLCILMPFNLVFYLDSLQKGRYRKIMACIMIVGIISCIVWPVMHFTNTMVFPRALYIIDTVLGIQILVIMVILIYENIKGYAKEYRYTSIGFAGFLICCIFEIVILNFLTIIQQDDIPMLAGLAFLLTLAVVQQMADLKQIREEGQKAVDLSETKSLFLASMSHEIRTPINAVLGMNEMILRENKDPVIAEYAESVKSSGQMLLMLVNDVLDFSKIEAGKMEINAVQYRLSELLRSIMPMLKERADEKGLRLSTVILNDIPDAQISDEFRIRQILINLINNAIKYTDSGSVTLMISAKEDTFDWKIIEFVVKDTGRGISEEGQKHLFEAFSRADMKKNGAIEGTGLGLAIVKSIVDSMGGEIRVTSEVNKGSEFTVAIPVGVFGTELLKEDFMEHSSRAASKKDSCDYRAPEANILVVDDNHSNLKLVTLFFKRTGIVPDTCDSGKKAVEKCKSKQYDLILLDHMMPELDGMETLKIIKSDSDSLNRNVPVIVLTANAVAGSRQIYIDAGFSEYLTKPIDSSLLEQTVRSFLPKEKILPAENKQNDDLPKTEADAEITVAETSAETPNEKLTLKDKLSAINGLDYDTAIGYVGGMEDLLAEVIGTVKDGYTENAETLRNSLAEGDLEAYRRTAHFIKGQMATFGLSEMSEWAKRHEFAAKFEENDYLKQDCDNFCEKYLEVCQALIHALDD